MLHDPETVVRSAYEALADRDLDAVLPLLARHVEVRVPDSLPFGGIYQGHEQVTHLIAEVASRFERFSLEPERILVTPPFVVALSHTSGRTRAGSDLDLASVGVWRVEDGLVELYKHFTDTAALARALQEPTRG